MGFAMATRASSTTHVGAVVRALREVGAARESDAAIDDEGVYGHFEFLDVEIPLDRQGFTKSFQPSEVPSYNLIIINNKQIWNLTDFS